VLDIGTGPFAVLALNAAAAGAKKVYCIEANRDAAERARQEIEWASAQIHPCEVEVFEGFSTDVELPEKVDLLVTEIAGSVASEEGLYATIQDAHRFMKQPHEPSSYIPFAYQTLGAPAVDMVHHSGGADPTRNFLRVEADDTTLQLLADPILVEDIRCADAALPTSGTVGPAEELEWQIDPERLAANEDYFRKRLKLELPEEMHDVHLPMIAHDLSRSLSGIALWPRLVFDESETMIYQSRGPRGEHQPSHWQTLLPLLAVERPVKVAASDKVRAEWKADLQEGGVNTPLVYSMACEIEGA